MMIRLRKQAILVVAGLALAACGDGEVRAPGEMAAGADSNGALTLTGAGATFPYPIYSKWFNAYSQQTPVRVNYQSIGSGGGIRQLTEGTVDFGASDAPMNEEEMAAAPGTLHFPTVVGAVVVSYNLPELQESIRISGDVIARMFLGEITRWNDPAIAELNPGVPLPDRDVIVVHRSDGSGTTYVFTEYLSTVSPEWQQRVGTGKAVSWPTGLGAKGNEGVAGQIRQTVGAVGYLEQVYAQQNNLSAAAVRNSSGAFVEPTLEATAAAAAGVADQLGEGGDFRVSLVDPAGAESYPIAAWTYLLVPSQIDDCAKARALAELGQWLYTEEADAMASELGYAPVPETVEALALESWTTVTCGPDSQPVIAGS